MKKNKTPLNSLVPQSGAKENFIVMLTKQLSIKIAKLI
jgi:hypothetical protein